jgi:hypothetical protein
MRFPWPQLYSTFSSGSNVSAQKPQICVSPTRTVFRLVSSAGGGVPTLAAGVDIRLVLFRSRDIDQNITAATPNLDDPTNPGVTPAYGALTGFTTAATTSRGTAVDIQFGAYAASGFKINGVAIAESPTYTLLADSLRFGGDNAVMIAIDKGSFLTSGNYALEVMRYGKVGG